MGGDKEEDGGREGGAAKEGGGENSRGRQQDRSPSKRRARLSKTERVSHSVRRVPTLWLDRHCTMRNSHPWTNLGKWGKMGSTK